jgi:hypothetical protein
VGLLPPDIDTALRIETQKGRRDAGLFCSDAGAAAPGVPCRVQFEYAKKFFALHATFRHDPLL